MTQRETYRNCLHRIEECGLEVVKDNLCDDASLVSVDLGVGNFLWFRVKCGLSCSLFLEGGSKVSAVFHKDSSPGSHLYWPYDMQEDLSNEIRIKWRNGNKTRVDFNSFGNKTRVDFNSFEDVLVIIKRMCVL